MSCNYVIIINYDADSAPCIEAFVLYHYSSYDEDDLMTKGQITCGSCVRFVDISMTANIL